MEATEVRDENYKAVIVAIVALLYNTAVITDIDLPDRCKHCIKVAINEKQALCMVCRTALDEPTANGITVTAPSAT